jgi:hypothetical protein
MSTSAYKRFSDLGTMTGRAEGTPSRICRILGKTPDYAPRIMLKNLRLTSHTTNQKIRVSRRVLQPKNSGESS